MVIARQTIFLCAYIVKSRPGGCRWQCTTPLSENHWLAGQTVVKEMHIVYSYKRQMDLSGGGQKWALTGVIHGNMHVIVLSCAHYVETYMFFCKCVHESTVTCTFPCITPVSAHFWPPLEKGPLVVILDMHTSHYSKLGRTCGRIGYTPQVISLAHDSLTLSPLSLGSASSSKFGKLTPSLCFVPARSQTGCHNMWYYTHSSATVPYMYMYVYKQFRCVRVYVNEWACACMCLCTFTRGVGSV